MKQHNAIETVEGGSEAMAGQIDSTLSEMVSENLHLALMERSRDAIIIIKDRVIDYINPRFARMVAYEASQILGEDIARVFTPQSLKIIEQRREGRMWGKDLPATYKIELCVRNGDILPVEAGGAVIESDGMIVELIMVREVATGAHPEEVCKVMAENSMVGAYIIQDRRFRFVNGQLQRDLGFTEDELMSIKPSDIVHPEDLAVIRQEVLDVMRDKGNCSHECRTMAKDGSVHQAFQRMAYVEYEGRPAVLGSYMDISERRNIEMALANATACYESIICSMPEMLFTFNENDEFSFFSPVCEQYVRHHADELIGMSKWEMFEELNLLTPESLVKVRDEEMHHLNSGTTVVGIEVEIFDKNGERIPMIYSAAQIRNAAGQPAGSVSLMSDASQIKKLESQLMDTVQKLKASQEELSTPVVEVWDKILALPLIGIVDSHRSQSIMEVLLLRIVETQAEMVILDITGVASMDTQVANHLIKTVQAANMLGTECMITGIKPEIAQTMIRLGLDVETFPTRRNLRDGLMYGLKKMGYQVHSAG